MNSLLESFDYLSFKNDELYLYSSNLADFLPKINVPCYLFLVDRFIDNYNYFSRSLQKHVPRFLIAYALKANYLGDLLKLSRQLGSGAEVMSMFELLLAKKAGFEDTKIVLNGPAKSIDELVFAIENDLKGLNVDSFSELKIIEQVARKFSIKRPISIRIHPQLSAETERRMLIKKNSKLGIDYARAKKLYKYAKRSSFLKVDGVHVHVGTNLVSHLFYDELLGFLNQYIHELESELDVFISSINLGGGLASRAQLNVHGFSLELFAKQIKENIDDIKDREIIFEPGRYLVGDSFLAIANVLRIKKSWGRQWAFIDVGANTLIPLRYSNFFLAPLNYKKSPQSTHVAGPLCLPVDIISNKAVNFAISEGDKVVVLNCGAYTLSMSEQFGYPRPPIFELRSDEIRLLKKGDDLTEMVNFWF